MQRWRRDTAEGQRGGRGYTDHELGPCSNAVSSSARGDLALWTGPSPIPTAGRHALDLTPAAPAPGRLRGDRWNAHPTR